ncbi:MAG: hypothetical protein ACXWF8_04770 [Methylobacter sp.]
MKRNKQFNHPCQDSPLEYKQCIAFHEAGHAAAIYLHNKTRNLPPIFFQIQLHDLRNASTTHDCLAKVEGGRFIESLPASIETLMHDLPDNNHIMMPLMNGYMAAFEADIINLLVGPLAEAKFIAETDGEPFSKELLVLSALKHYGGSSDLDLAYEYLSCFSAEKALQEQKLAELFNTAFDFVNDRRNWKAITKLANFIIASDKNTIDCNEVALLLES